MEKIWIITLIHFSIFSQFKLGIENISQKLVNEFRSKNIALVTNQTGKDQKGKSTITVLKEKGFSISALFAPEHGIEGKIAAGDSVQDVKNNKLKIPVLSLYEHGKGKTINNELLKNIDALFFDIQDSGMRHYTYISTLYQVLEAAALTEKRIIVFDRPNPLGMIMEGPLVDPALKSFISIAEIPLRHGMTIGELAEYFNKYILLKKAKLTVIPMKNYERNSILTSFHAPLSPNIKSPVSCFGYSFLGLLGEIKPFEVGVGTDFAFQVIMLPESLNVPMAVWAALAIKLKLNGIDSQPHALFIAHKNQRFKGLLLAMPDINQVMAFNAFLTIVSHMKKSKIDLNFSQSFDKAAGSSKIRSYFLGLASYKELIEDINLKLQEFFPRAQSVFKYLPHPNLNFI